MGTFVIINVFIAIVINNLEQSKAEQLKVMRIPVSGEDLLDELARTQQALIRLRARMERLE
jgi:voltage-gated sodium channel